MSRAKHPFHIFDCRLRGKRYGFGDGIVDEGLQACLHGQVRLYRHLFCRDEGGVRFARCTARCQPKPIGIVAGFDRVRGWEEEFLPREELDKYADSVAAASWDSVIFDLPDHDSLQRVPTLDPLRGTKEHVGDLLDSSPTAADLVSVLTSQRR